MEEVGEECVQEAEASALGQIHDLVVVIIVGVAIVCVIVMIIVIIIIIILSSSSSSSSSSGGSSSSSSSSSIVSIIAEPTSPPGADSVTHLRGIGRTVLHYTIYTCVYIYIYIHTISVSCVILYVLVHECHVVLSCKMSFYAAPYHDVSPHVMLQHVYHLGTGMPYRLAPLKCIHKNA